MKKMLTLILCLAALLVIGGLSAAHAATEGFPYIDVRGSTSKLKNTGFIYSDGMLLGNSSDMSRDLIKASAVLAAAGYSSNATSMLQAMGYSDVAMMNDAQRSLSDNDKVAFTSGYKDVEGTNIRIVCVVVRGTPQNCEWFSNFNVGDGAGHLGFRLAADDVETHINAQLKAAGDRRVILWLTGHSRGAAVANILAAQYTYQLGAANVFAYTFACPAVSKIADEDLDNIFNFNNAGDLVPLLPMENWDYKRNGKTIDLAMRSNDSFLARFASEMKTAYAGTTDSNAYRQAIRSLFPGKEEDLKEPIHRYVTMYLAWSLGAKYEIPFEEFCVYYAPQALLDASKSALKKKFPILSQISTLVDAASEIETTVALIKDFQSRTQDMDEDEFEDFMDDHQEDFKRIAQVTGQTISEFGDLSIALNLIVNLAVPSYTAGELLACVADFFAEDTGNIVDAILHAHDSSTYVLYVNAAYYGYKGVADTDVKSLNLWNSNTTSIGAYCFQNCDSLTRARLNEVAYIAPYAFECCTALEDVDFADAQGLRVIADHAFNGCSALTSANLVQVEQIGESAFNGCSALASAVIPDSIESLGSYAFGNCTALAELTAPVEFIKPVQYGPFRASFKELGTTVNIETMHFTTNGDGILPDGKNESGVANRYDYNLPFLCRKALTHVDFAEGVNRIGDYAFYCCAMLEEVELPTSLLSIGNYAFNGASALANMPVLPEGFTTLGQYSFAASAIQEVKLPSTVDAIPTGCFNGCSGLTALVIPNTVTSLGGYCFGNCPNIVELTAPVELIKPVQYSPFRASLQEWGSTVNVASIHFTTNGDGVLPDGKNESGVANRFDYNLPFLCRKALTHVDFAEGVNRIGDYAFYCCAMLEEVELPTSLLSIGNYAFNGASALANMPVLPEGFTTLGQYSFASSGIQEVKLPSTVTTIPTGCFNDCAGLTALVIPNTITSLGGYCFGNCPNIVELTAPVELIKPVQYGPFRASFQEWGSTVNVASIHFTTNSDGILPDGKNESGVANRFDYNLPFLCRKALTHVDFAEGVNRIGDYAFYYCAMLEEVELPTSLLSIGNYAFNGASALANMPVLPEGFTTLGQYSFASSGIQEVKLPSTVTTIPTGCFNDCAGLTALVIPNTITSLGGYCFGKCPNITELTVPVELIKPTQYGSFRDSFETASTTVNIEAIHFTTNGDGIMPDCSNTSSDGKLYSYNLPYLCRAALKRVDFAEGVTRIGHYALSYCAALSEVELPSTLESIGNYTFSGTKALLDMPVLPEGFTTLGQYAFAASAIREVKLPSTVASIPTGCFNGCSGLTALVIPNTVTSLGGYCFGKCPNITELTVPVELMQPTPYGSFRDSYSDASTTVNIEAIHFTTNGDGIMPDCSNTSSDGKLYSYNLPYLCRAALKRVDFAEGVTRIGNYALSYCAALSKVQLPSTLESIGNYAFNGVKLLDAPIRVPEAVTAIGTNAFGGVNLPPEVYPYSGGLDYVLRAGIPHTLLEYRTLTLPAALATVEEEAFADTTAQLVILPEGVCLEGRAFAGGSVRVIVLPDTIGEIAPDAFEGCPVRAVVCAQGSPAQAWAEAQGYAVRFN